MVVLLCLASATVYYMTLYIQIGKSINSIHIINYNMILIDWTQK